MKKYPSVYTLESLLKTARNSQAGIDGQWVPARPIGFASIGNRIKCAWLVFLGKGDVLIWPQGQ